MADDILLDVHQGVAVITFNQPDKLNTFTSAMMHGLGEAYRECDSNDEVRAVVVTGAGKAFCAGADMSAGAETFGGAGENPEFSSCPLAFQAWDVRKPVLAACNGHAIGVGLGLALQADMRVFAEEGKYGLLQTRRGVVADFAVEHLLPRLVGFERAFELVVRAQRFSGTQAGEWGLASRVEPAPRVLETAMEIALDMAVNCSPLVMALHKRLLWKGREMPLADFVELETRALHHSIGKADAAEGGLAYLEKRPPQWQTRLSTDWPAWMD